jgi:hypothetical protein
MARTLEAHHRNDDGPQKLDGGKQSQPKIWERRADGEQVNSNGCGYEQYTIVAYTDTTGRINDQVCWL